MSSISKLNYYAFKFTISQDERDKNKGKKYGKIKGHETSQDE